MFERTDRDTSLIRRGAILALAALLLFAQAIAGAHFHQKDFRDNLTRDIQGNDALCSLCLFYSHAPASPVAAPITATPFAAEERITPAARTRLHTTAASLLFARAPPTSL
ncbi:MAG: hypothetical protein ABSG46_12035 [Candidatus Binataceae bacterium]